jgi:uncharacterized protein YraI
MKKIFVGLVVLAGCAVSFSASAKSVVSPAAMRQGPGMKWPVIAEIPAGARVDFVNCGPGWKHNWCHVKYGGRDGYVNANTLAPSGSGRSVAVAPVITTDAAYMRKGPGTKWPVVGVLIPKSEVNVSQCIKGWLSGWCRVSSGGSTGWVRGSLLKRQGALFD